MSEYETYVRIDGEPFLGRAKAYREAMTAYRRAWSAFAQSKGGTGYCQTGRSIVFSPGKQPEGWTKPNGQGLSHPKVKHPDLADFERMRAEHPRPSSRDVYGDAVCFNASYETDKGTGSLGLGGFGMIINGPHVGWAGDTFLGHIPDAEAFVRDFAERHPEKRIVGPAATWTLPAGLTRLTDAEYALIFAEYKVSEERAAALASKAA